MIYKKGVHRPLVAGVQNVVGVEVDGFWGENTEKAVRSWLEGLELPYSGILAGEGLRLLLAMMPISAKIFEVIAICEVGEIRNAWGQTCDIGDGAGKNYGPLQVNRLGSVSALRKYLPEGERFEDWIGTPDGAVATMHWFEEYHMAKAREIVSEIMGLQTEDERAIGLAVDAIVQGGFPPQNHAYLWKDLPEGDLWKQWEMKTRELYDRKGVKPSESFRESVAFGRSIGLDPVDVFAELHPRSGQSRYLGDQLSRRRLWARGEGFVHGEFLRLSDFGL